MERLFNSFLGFPILDAKRELLMEEILNVIIKDIPRPITCFFFTDLIIVAELSSEGTKPLRFITLDEYSFIRNKPDTYYFKNLFTIQGREGGLSFTTHTVEAKKNIVEYIFKNIFLPLRQKKMKKAAPSELKDSSGTKNHLLDTRIKVKGTVRRGYLAFKFYTLYCVELSLKNEKTIRFYLRYSELSNLQIIIAKKHPEVTLPQLPPKNWMSSQKNKIIEFRKIVVENFLQSVFKNHILTDQKNIEEVLLALNVPRQIQKVLLFPEKYQSQAYENVENELIERLGRSSVLYTLMEESVVRGEIGYNKSLSEEIKAKKTIFQLDVHLPTGAKVHITVKHDTLVKDICTEVASKMKMISWLDFQLLIKRPDGEEIRMDENEPVFKALGLISNQSESPVKQKSSFLSSFLTGLKGMFSKELKLVFQKYYCLDSNFEKSDIYLDEVKLEMIASQLFKQVFTKRFTLVVNDFMTICALYLYLTKGKFHPLPRMTEYLKSFIPKSFYVKKTDQQWIDCLVDEWLKYTEIIEKIRNANIASTRDLDYYEGVQKKKDSDDDVTTNRKSIAHMILIETLKKNQLFGSNFFHVKPYKKKKIYSNKIDETFLKLPNDVILAIRHDIIMILPSGDTKVENYSKFLLLSCEGSVYRFNTLNSLEIAFLIEKYIYIRQNIKNRPPEEEEEGGKE